MKYRVMHLGDTYQIQQLVGRQWEKIGEFDNLNSAKKMLLEIKKGTICG